VNQPAVRSGSAGSLGEDLVQADLLVPSGVPGVFGHSRAFVELVERVDTCITEAMAPTAPEVFRFPPVMPRATFLETGYLRSFPDLVGSIHGFCGGDAEHADLLHAVEEGRDWTDALSPTDLMLVPAACLPLYPMATGRLPEEGRVFDVLGTCFRREPSADPARLQIFRMRECVRLGRPDDARAFRDYWLERAEELLSELDLAVRADVANDPFFGRVGRLLAGSQRAEALKYEILATIADRDRPTPVASCNLHRDHLTSAFGIEDADGGVAHSACVGFGLERIVLALFAAHGLDLSRWPSGVRDRLWL
jgi:seryl-tRNA synthetase